MTNTIYIKSSQTGDSAPSAGSGLKIGEVAINTNDGFMFMGQKTAGSVGDNSTAVKTIGMPIVDSDSLGTSDATLSTTGNVKAYADTKATTAEAHAYVEANALTLTAALTMGAHVVVPTGYDVQIADAPGSATDAANKAYVDSVAQGLYIHEAVKGATTGSFAMTSTASTTTLVLADGEGGFSASANTFTQDGVATYAADDRILIKDGVNSNSAGVHNKWNGIYTVGSLTGSTLTLTRATDFDAAADMKSGAFVFVQEGTANADSGFVMTQDGAITVGTTAITWSQFSGAGQITAGTGISKSGNTLSADDSRSMTVGGGTPALTLANGSITDGSGAISFGNENLSTSGTLGAGAATVTSLDAGSGSITTTGTITADVIKLEGGTYDTTIDPGTPTASVTYTLPAADGSGGQFLSTAGNGTLSWSTASASDVDVNVSNLTARLPQVTESVTIGDATDVTVTTSGNLTSTGDMTVTGGDVTLGAAAVAGTIGLVASAHDAAGNALTISGGATTAGTSNDQAGGAVTIVGGQGKGSGDGGSIIFKSATAGGSGSSLNNADDTILTLASDLSATFTGSITGATISGGTF